MRNLAGCDDSDIWAAAELTAAGIAIEVVTPYGEPNTRVSGKLGAITFRRAWRYWVADGPVPLDVARRLYADPVGATDVRVAGHCGCPAPEAAHIDWHFPNGEEVCHDPDGHQAAEWDRFAKAHPDLLGDKRPVFAPDPAAIGAVATIEKYHIDSPEGLRLFADAVRR